MTDSEKLDLIFSKLEKLDSIEVKLTSVETRLDSVEIDIQELKRCTTHIELTLENETNRNIQLLAENHITLIDKLNQSVKVADKTLMYEVQMTSLKSRIDLLEKEIATIKSQIA